MIKVKFKDILASYILLSIIFLGILFYFNHANTLIKMDFSVLSTFMINLVLIIFGILIDVKSFTLNKTFWYFNLFFMFLAPLFQYITGYRMWGYSLSNDIYFKVNIFLMTFFIVYILIYNGNNLEKYKSQIKLNIVLEKKKLFVWLSFSFVAMILIILLVGWNGLFNKNENNVDLGDGLVNTVINNSLRAVPVFAFAYSIYYYSKNNEGLFCCIIFSLITLLMNNPSSLARYWCGSIYIGIFMIIYRKIFNGDKMPNRTFDIVMLITFSIIFPILQLFKWYGINEIITGEATKDLINVYNNVDFDAYSMFGRTINYVEATSITFGRQLSATLLFFVPRAIWSGKPNHSGDVVASFQGQSFTNLACPIPAEGYINFGFLGVIFYGIILAFVLKKLDLTYWKEKDSINYIDMIYPFLIGFLIYLLRGAFHPVCVYMFTFYIPIIVSYLIGKKIKFKKNRRKI